MRHAPHHLKRGWIISRGLVALALFAMSCATSSPSPPGSESAGVKAEGPTPKELRSIRVAEEKGFLNVMLVGSEGPQYTAFKAMDPVRLVVELPNTVAADALLSPVVVDNDVISKIETTVLSSDAQPMTRVTFGLNRETSYDINTEDEGIRVRFQLAQPTVEAAAATQPEVATETKGETPSPGGEAEEKTVTSPPPVAPPPTAEAEKETLAPATKLIAIQPFTTEQLSEISLVTDGKLPEYHAFPLTNPPRIVVDLMGIKSGLDRNAFPLNGSLASKARIGKYKDKVRVVIDLIPAKGLPYEVVPGNDRLLLSLKTGSGFSTQQATAEVTQPAAPATAATEGPAAVIKAIDFHLLESGHSRVTITADRKLEPAVEVTGAQSLSLILKNAELPKRLMRQIDTGQFASAINVIDPRLASGATKTVDIRLDLREMVPYRLSPAGSQVYLDLDPSAVLPPKPIQLGKPATLTEGRTPPPAAETVTEQPPVAPPGKEVGAEAPAPEKEAAAVTEPTTAPSPSTEAAGAPEKVSGEAEPVAETPPPAAPVPPPVKAAPPPPVRAARPTPVSSLQTAYTGEPISLDLQDVDIRNVLRLLADVTGKNLVVEPEVKGRVTLKVERVPWDQVLDLILKINNLDKVIEGNVIRVATAEKIKAERERRLAALEAEQKRLAAVKDVGEISTAYLQVNYADAKHLAAQIDKIKSDKGSISVDERTSLIIYTDYPKRIDNARMLISRLDRATPQVMIEARIVEASTNFSRNLGIQWGGTWYTSNGSATNLGSVTGNGTLTGTTVTNPPNGFPQPQFAVDAPVASVGSLGLSLARLAGNNLLVLDMKLSALEGAGEAKLVSSPRIFTLDNVEANIQQGENIPYPQQTQDGISTSFTPATLSLTVTPHITPDDRVRLQVKAQNDFADFSRTVNGSPAINTRSAKTELLVNSGDTIVIGGIVKTDKSWSESRVPFLSRIPVLSWLFKSREVTDDKSELLIFLSPTIMRDSKTVI
jgi:type IV pilus assembly protein PilQ